MTNFDLGTADQKKLADEEIELKEFISYHVTLRGLVLYKLPFPLAAEDLPFLEIFETKISTKSALMPLSSGLSLMTS